MTTPHICINLINLSAELSLIMLTLLKRYKEHKKMPSQHRVSGERGGGMGEGGVEGLGGGAEGTEARQCGKFTGCWVN